LVCPDALNIHKKLCKRRFGCCDSCQADGLKKHASIQAQVTSDHPLPHLPTTHNHRRGGGASPPPALYLT